MNGYELSKKWFDFAFETDLDIKPAHVALFFWLVELNNRLNWKEKIGVPTEMAMTAIGVKNHRTYKKTLDDLEKWGFVIIHNRSKNQFSALVLALVKNTKASPKQIQEQVQGIAHIDKPLKTVKTNKPLKTIKEGKSKKIIFPFESKEFLSVWETWKEYKKKEHRFSYKSEISENAALQKLKELSNDNEQRSIQIINDSIANGYKGLFSGASNDTKTGKRSNDPHQFKQADMDYSKRGDETS